jgi:hypothetical protein
MQKARLRVMAGLAGAALCLFAITSSAQNTNAPPAGSSDPAAQTAAPPTTAQPTTPPADASVPATTDAQTTNSTVTRSTATDVATTDGTTTTTSFPAWGIIAIGLLVILALFGLFRRRDRTVVTENYTSNTTNTVPTSRPVGMGTATGDRTLNTRVASDTTTTTTTRSGVTDPNARS